MNTNPCIALVGNPNAGKTTIFNALTGLSQRVGNWPGVTVEKKSGFFVSQQHTIEVIDLPGTYNLTVLHEAVAKDEQITSEFVTNNKADLLVNVVDASNLQRNLYLTLQCRELGIPMIVVLNMVDVMAKKGFQLDIPALQAMLQCPVIKLEHQNKTSLKNLQDFITKNMIKQITCEPLDIGYPYEVVQYQNQLTAQLQEMPHTLGIHNSSIALRLLEGDDYLRTELDSAIQQPLRMAQQQLTNQLGEDMDIVIADSRYRFIQQQLSSIYQRNKVDKAPTPWLDKLVLNRFLGIPIFFAVMYLMFVFAINVGGAFQDLFDISSNAIFVHGLSQLLLQWHVPHWFVAIVASGLGKGINTTITFIPVIGGMFLFLSFLEDSGYMARAAFVMDRLMQALGLPGKSFVPLIVGFGCNVPAIMSTRTLENKRDRILTVMMSPFMSCGARLAIFAVFTAAFFPQGGQNIVFALYLIGIIMAVLTGLMLRKTILNGEPSPMVMELPAYHMPRLAVVLQQTWQRLKNFVWKAGRIIIPVCILIGALNALTLSGQIVTGDVSINSSSAESVLSWLGKSFTPIFTPMGIHQDNWPATVGLFTGILAKEVVIGTLNTLYAQVGHIGLLQDQFNLWASLQQAFASVPEKLSHLPQALLNPVVASAPDDSLSKGVMGVMYQHFASQTAAFAYLLFVLLYIPCVSTAAAMAREASQAWMIFSVTWNTSLAYGVAVAFYQALTWSQHPLTSSLWLGAIVVGFSLFVWGLKWFAQEHVSTDAMVAPHVN